MEENQNFLTILQNKLQELIELGYITEEELRAGIQIDESCLYSSTLARQEIVRTMIDILKTRTDTYEYQCGKAGRNPNKTKSIRLYKNNENIEMAISGNDGFSKFIISNYKDPNNPILQLSPEEFETTVFNNMQRREKRKIRNLLGDENEVVDILKTANSSSIQNLIRAGIGVGLKEIPQNFAEYYKYLINEKRINEEIERRAEEDSKIIYGGILDIDKDERGPVTRVGGEQKPRVNDEISFEDRDAFLKSLDFKKMILYSTIEENPDKSAAAKPYNAYIFDLKPGKNGFLLISEPYSGTQISKAVFIPQEKLLPGDEQDDEFWKMMADHYLTSSKTEFREEERTYVLNHTSRDNYFGTIETIIKQARAGEIIKTDNVAINARVDRITKRLFEGRPYLNIKKAVGGVTEQEIDELKKQLEEPEQHNNKEQLDHEQRTNEENDSGEAK